MKNETKKIIIGVVLVILAALVVVAVKLGNKPAVRAVNNPIVVQPSEITPVNEVKPESAPAAESVPEYTWEGGIYTETPGWMRFQYPNQMGNFKFTTYFGRGEGRDFGWLHVNVVPGTFSCKEIRAIDSPDNWGSGITIINGRKYCERGEADAAMGSSYAQSEYTAEISGKLVTFSFGTRSTSCGPYDEPVRSECEQERAKYSFGAIDKMEKDVVDRMAQSVTFGDEVKWWTNTHIKSGITFQYPNQLDAEFRSFQDNGSTETWPPQVAVSSGAFTCSTTADADYEPGNERRKLRVVDGKEYCITTLHDAGAGSRWDTHDYTAVVSNKLVTFTFTVHSSNCGFYESEATSKACYKEDELFKDGSYLDRIVDKMMRSVKFTE